ncbi:E3 ubiquitin-protein ligase parkin-like [Oscarella lobularis]|uniref:E3 ubiquitin-protein ligase parkin-like n=1 Tax=Oscarella lobularis TaxID=121494 RepID=UPI0033142B80
MSSVRLIVRFDSHRGTPVDVDPSLSVRGLKEQIARSRGLQPSDIRIIFSGRELKDDMTIRDYEFDRQSIVHVVRGSANRGRSRDINLRHVTGALASLPETSELASPTSGVSGGSSSAPPAFYVYCKNPCNQLQPGKIRVRCASCKGGTFVLDQDPSGWDDVLQSGRIRGRCLQESCNGRTAEFYFKCSAHPTDEKDFSMPLYLIRTNTLNVPCITCGDEQEQVLVFPCASMHVICTECFAQYCITKLNDRRFIETPDHGYTLACPAGCENSHIHEVHHFRLLGPEQYERYQRFATEECVLQMGGILCPQTGCGMGILPEDERRRIRCPQCSHVFCRLCYEPYHTGSCQRVNEVDSEVERASQYAVDPERAEMARWDSESRETIHKTTKPCPSCRVPIEKNGGCMHMTCPRQSCGHEWCWICEKAWTRECQSSHWFG